jgi:hypothetical protein
MHKGGGAYMEIVANGFPAHIRLWLRQPFMVKEQAHLGGIHGFREVVPLAEIAIERPEHV